MKAVSDKTNSDHHWHFFQGKASANVLWIVSRLSEVLVNEGAMACIRKSLIKARSIILGHPSGLPIRLNGYDEQYEVWRKRHTPSLDTLQQMRKLSEQMVATQRAKFRKKWTVKCAAVAASLEEAGDELFTFTKFPRSQWKALRTTNAIERINEEFRRRTKTQASLPGEEAVLLLMYGLLRSGQIRLRRLVGWKDLPTSIRVVATAEAA